MIWKILAFFVVWIFVSNRRVQAEESHGIIDLTEDSFDSQISKAKFAIVRHLVLEL